MEVNEDSICSTGKLVQVEAHPVAEEVISSKIHMPTKLKDTTMYVISTLKFLLPV